MGRAFASAEAQFIELYDNCCLPRFDRRWRIITSGPSADISSVFLYVVLSNHDSYLVAHPKGRLFPMPQQ